MVVSASSFAGLNDVAEKCIFYLRTGYDASVKKGNSPHRAPSKPLKVEIDGHTLIFPYSFDELVTIELTDEYDNLIYTGYLYPGQTSFSFPESFSGEYAVSLSVGSCRYTGILEL